LLAFTEGGISRGRWLAETRTRAAANLLVGGRRIQSSLLPPATERDDLATMLHDPGMHVVTLKDWSAIDAAEIELGRTGG
jgi:hypothetical protein